MNTSIKKLDDGRQTESMTSLFLSQSYQDAWDDYARSLKKEGFARWDYIVLTASNEEQAEGFHAQIALRQKEKLLPSTGRRIHTGSFLRGKTGGRILSGTSGGQKSCLGDPASIQNETSAPFPGQIPSFRNHS